MAVDSIEFEILFFKLVSFVLFINEVYINVILNIYWFCLLNCPFCNIVTKECFFSPFLGHTVVTRREVVCSTVCCV